MWGSSRPRRRPSSGRKPKMKPLAEQGMSRRLGKLAIREAERTGGCFTLFAVVDALTRLAPEETDANHRTDLEKGMASHWYPSPRSTRTLPRAPDHPASLRPDGPAQGTPRWPPSGDTGTVRAGGGAWTPAAGSRNSPTTPRRRQSRSVNPPAHHHLPWRSSH
jgi:hypothetical protein